MKIVKALLSSPDSRFEVVVSDDASSDNVRELLSGIHDPRFKYFRNENNLGAHKNWLRSLELGTGRWLYLIMGRDMMHGENVSRLIAFLEQAEQNGVLYLRDNGHYRDGIRISEGMNAMIDFIGTNHQTGEIFRREDFMAIQEREHYFSISDMYPENYAIRDLLLKGKGAFIHSGVVEGGFATDKAKVKSQVEYAADIEKAYFAPPRKLKQFYEQIDMIDELSAGTFTDKERDAFFKDKYTWTLEYVSYWFRIWCRHSMYTAHYGQPVRYIGIPEMVRNIFRAHSETAAHLKDKGTYTFRRRIIMYWCTAKTAVKVSVKSLIRSIIEPLGIWKILHYIRNY